MAVPNRFRDLLIAWIFLVAGCGSVPPAPVVNYSGGGLESRESGQTYVVKKGDTLFGIALDTGFYYRDIQAWNNLENPNLIYPGQVLRLAPSSGALASTVSRDNSTAKAQAVQSSKVQARSALEEKALAPISSQPVVANGKLLREPNVRKQPYSEEAYQRHFRPEFGAGQPPAGGISPLSAPAQASLKTPDQVQASAAHSLAESGAGGSWLWPAQGKLLAGFGDAAGGGKGIDIAGNPGDPVRAVGEGKVVYVGSGLRGYGQMVIIKHENNYLTAYAHNRKLLVTEGQNVTQGQKIAEMGDSDTDRVKLHFEVRKQGKPVDPVPFLTKG